MTGPPVDLRLLPAATACWGACLLGTRTSVRTSLVLAALAGTALVVGLVAPAVLRGRPGSRRHRTSPDSPAPAFRRRPDGRRPHAPPLARRPHDRRPDRPAGAAAARGHVLLVLVLTAAGLASAGTQGWVRDAGLLGALAADGAQVRVVGTVRSEPVPLRSTASWAAGEDRVRVDLAVEHVVGGGRSGPAAARLLVLAGEQWRDVAYGSRVETLGMLERTAPGDSALAILVVRGPPTPLGEPGSLDARVRTIRQALLQVSDPLPPDRRGLVPGAAIGDTSRVPADLDEAMRIAGLTHITAVSGAHFAIVGGVVLALTALAGLPRSLRAVVVGTAMGGFVLLVHPTPSVLRAAATGAVGVMALVLGRPARAVPALATCVVVLLVVDPWLAGSVGFTLSVAATAGIVLGSGPLARGLQRVVPERAARLVAVPLAAQCACGPVVAALAPGLATYAVPANVLAAPAVPPATVLGVLAALVAPWWESGGTAGAAASGWATAWIATVARTAAALPGAQLPWPAGPWGPVLLAVATLGSVVAVARPWRGRLPGPEERPAAPARPHRHR